MDQIQRPNIPSHWCREVHGEIDFGKTVSPFKRIFDRIICQNEDLCRRCKVRGGGGVDSML